MANPHILVADWLLPDFDQENKALEQAGVTWCLPTWTPPPPPREQQRQELLERIAKAARVDGVLFQLAPLDAEVINALPDTCKILQRVGIGLDTVDIPTAKQRSIAVKNTPNYCVEEVAVHAMSLLLSLHRQLAATQENLLAGRWSDRPPKPIERLSTLTLGIIGLGRIGHRFAGYMKPFVKNILYYDPACSATSTGLTSVALDELLCQSDIISLHCPLLPETRHLLNADTLKLVKQNALIINVARGGLLDAVALADRLNRGYIAGAGLDVYEPEILPLNSPLRKCKNILLTSHTGWYSRQATVDARTEAMNSLLQGIRT